jgi:hypothetical protein
VELQDAKLSPLSGVGTLKGLSVGNPKGWSEQNAFHLGLVHVNMEPFSVLGDHIVINEIIIEQPEFLYETKIVASNIGDLLKNIEQTLGKPGAEPKAESGQPVKMVIKKLSLQGGKVTLGFGPTAMTMPMPPVNLTELGTAEGGITPTQVAAAVMRSVTASVVAATTKAMTTINGTSGAAAAEAAKDTVNAIKGLFSGKKKETTAPAAGK